MNILLEMPFTELEKNTKQAFGNDRHSKASTVKVTSSVFIPDITNDRLIIEAESRTDGDTYMSRIIFDNVIFKDDGTPDMARIITVDGSEYYFNRINKSKANVKVGCSCLDFHYRFASYNFKHGALADNAPKPYVKKTDRPPVNPTQVAGLCKHLIRVFNELRTDNIFA